MLFASIIPRLVHSLPVFVMVCLLAVPVIFLRLFGVLFFASTTPMWALVPAVTLGSLLFISGRTNAVRRTVAIFMVVWYLLSIFFHGWGSMKFRIDEGQVIWFEIIEATLILILVTRCLTAKRDPG